ncbi:hypothetical protein ICM05_08165 [Leucobacter sp. cx-42]|uniref:hypothetical protein n=1 Tax=unclassified Leucobacter TaxID=2621730 RepID=UPI00165DE4A6|nr:MULTISPECIES: hypothetical protein [unclassified Leucobacter]MBC9954618.1 hypothetical protein [Leucobacter sp. cx-42]
MKIIWATRGKTWGFKFLRADGCADPLPAFEQAFRGAPASGDFFARTNDNTGFMFRLMDPRGRTDRSGRVIPHEIIVFGDPAETVQSLDDALREIWPELSVQYDAVWDMPPLAG